MKVIIEPDYSEKPYKKGKINLKKFFKLDLSAYMLIVSNIITIFFAIKENWSLLTIMLIYWFQSVTIGLFNFIRILRLKNFSTENFYINKRPVKPTERTKKFTALFFAIHYGFFHFGYLVFLLQKLNIKATVLFPIIISSIVFFVNHLFSFLAHREELNKKQNIGKVMFFPYARIIPMHLTIVFGVFLIKNPIALVFFLLLKTFADLVMHQLEHAWDINQ